MRGNLVRLSHHFRYRLLLSSQIQQEINPSDEQKMQINAWSEVLKQEIATLNDEVKAAPAELREAKEKELSQQLEVQRRERLTKILCAGPGSLDSRTEGGSNTEK